MAGKRTIVRFSAAVVLAVLASAVAAQDHKRAMVELFTSQGCSSCPPADALIAQLAKDPNYVVMSLPIDYWDYIGWKDTFASPAFTWRQKAYAAARGDNHVYTPQVVVDGIAHAVGSDREEIISAAESCFGRRGAMQVPLAAHHQGDRLLVSAGAAATGGATTGALWLARVARSRTVAIGRGENSGRSVTYTNVLRSLRKIGDWSGKPAEYEVAHAELNGTDADAAFLILQGSQGSIPGVVLAATAVP